MEDGEGQEEAEGEDAPLRNAEGESPTREGVAHGDAVAALEAVGSGCEGEAEVLAASPVVVARNDALAPMLPLTGGEGEPSATDAEGVSLPPPPPETLGIKDAEAQEETVRERAGE